MAEQIFVFAGTRKGLFIFKSNTERQTWEVAGPQFAGWGVHDVTYDPRDGMLYAAFDHAVYGANVQRSSDMGQNWEMAVGPRFGEEDEDKVARVWCVQPGHADRPGVVWAGVDPGGLFKSEDSGKTWHAVNGINNHPTREQWSPGAGGMMVHTIVPDPTNADRMFVAISAAGVYRSRDGGDEWEPLAKGLPQEDAYLAIYREALHTDACDTAGVYFGTTTGTAYYSRNEGDTWEVLSDTLPPVYSISTAVVQ